jgi:hypothetical protein
MVGHGIDANHGSSRYAGNLVRRAAHAGATFAKLTRGATLAANPAVLDVARQIATLATADTRRWTGRAVGARGDVGVSAAVGDRDIRHGRVPLAGVVGELLLQSLELPKVGARREPQERKRERGDRNEATANYHVPRTAKPPPPLDKVPATATPLSRGAVK